MDETAYALLESRARKLWDEREKGFPKFTRMTWEQGTRPAKYAALCQAQRELIAEGYVEITETGLVICERHAMPLRMAANRAQKALGGR